MQLPNGSAAVSVEVVSMTKVSHWETGKAGYRLKENSPKRKSEDLLEIAPPACENKLRQIFCGKTAVMTLDVVAAIFVFSR